MAQQSIQFLSQPSSRIFHPTKPAGGKQNYAEGPSGDLALKITTMQDNDKLRAQAKIDHASMMTRMPIDLTKFHYETSELVAQSRRNLGVMDLPPKPTGSIPGYSGFVPRKESTNVIGASYKKCNLESAELFAMEQVGQRAGHETSKPPEATLKTPFTGTY